MVHLKNWEVSPCIKGSFLNAIWSHLRRAELYQVSRQCETLAASQVQESLLASHSPAPLCVSGTGGGSIPDF